MRATNFATLLAAVVLGLATSLPADAHGGRHYRPRAHVGVYFGAPLLWYHPGPNYYYPYRYYYPPVVAAPASPPVYVERGDSYSPPGESQGYWYYCPAAEAYYPYVKQCAGGWQRVAPQPPN